MTNREYFERYALIPWAIEQNLEMMLAEYHEECQKENCRINPVSFTKKFMKEETFAEVEMAEANLIEKNKVSGKPNNEIIIDVDPEDYTVIAVNNIDDNLLKNT